MDLNGLGLYFERICLYSMVLHCLHQQKSEIIQGWSKSVSGIIFTFKLNYFIIMLIRADLS